MVCEAVSDKQSQGKKIQELFFAILNLKMLPNTKTPNCRHLSIVFYCIVLELARVVLAKAFTPAANRTCACCVVGPGVSKSPKRSTWPGHVWSLVEAWYACHACTTLHHKRIRTTRINSRRLGDLGGTAWLCKALQGESKTCRQMLRQMLRQVESLQAHPLTSMHRNTWTAPRCCSEVKSAARP